MPDASLPSTTAGWVVALLASVVGFFAGFATIAIASKVIS